MKIFIKSKFFGAILYLISIQVLALAIMFIFRVIFLIIGYENITLLENRTELLINCFLLALRYDNIVASYILIVPLIILPLLSLANIFNKGILRISNIYFVLLYLIVFLVSSMDIPYFQYFFRHINASIFNWADYGDETVNMIFAESSYYIYFLIFFVLLLLFIFGAIAISRYILRRYTTNLSSKYIIHSVAILAVGYTVCYFGTKGNINRPYSMEVQHAYFSNDSFINQMVISPSFYMYKSFDGNKPISETILMDEKSALEIAEKHLGIDLKYERYDALKNDSSHIATSKPNIVLVLIESFSEDYLNVKIDEKPLMPFFTELISKSYRFNNFYSQGTHTNQGIASTLYGFPAIFDRQMMKSVDLANFGRAVTLEDALQEKSTLPLLFNGLPQDLTGHGYKSMFSVTHIASYDNMGAFLKSNGFDQVYSKEDYPQSDWVNVWGVNDQFLLNYSLAQMDDAHKQGQPFLSGMMTISNHPPVYYSKEFENVSRNNDEKAMAYTDYCIKEFMESASKRDWYDNTIFLFLGDHGKIIGTSPYDMHLSLNQVPLIIYSTLLQDTPRLINTPASQLDVYATVMGLLGTECSYNTFGIDLLKKEQDYVYFTSDEKLGCMGKDYFFVHNITSGQQFLYDLKTQKNVLQENEAQADSMKNYSYAMIESAKYILKHQMKKSE